MPELPEVESIRKDLNKQVSHKTIEDVNVYWDNIIESPKPVEVFKENLLGQEIQKVDRRGKLILFYLDDFVLISHLRMEGNYALYPSDEPLENHTHVILKFTDGTQLRYKDVRKFGRMSLVAIGEEFYHKSLAKLGPEPVESQLELDWMVSFLVNKQKAIKTLLLDQALVVGVGNIYADEILFDSKIHPERPGASLNQTEVKTLRHSIIRILQEATEMGGSTIRSYKNMLGETGRYQDYHQVYGKPDQACPKCGTQIVKIKLNGRGTHFCPHCQS